MMEGEKTYTVGGSMRAASLETVCQWVKESWEEIGEEMVRYSFKKCGILVYHFPQRLFILVISR